MSNERQIRLLACWTAAVALAIGAAGLKDAVAKDRSAQNPAWPSDLPRVALEDILELDRLQGRSAARLLGILAGRPARSRRLLGRPFGAAWEGESLLITDPAAGRVLSIGPRGRQTASIGAPFQAPIGVVNCDLGVVVSDSRRGSVGLLDQRLRFVRWLAEGLERPTGVACREDTIVVAETGRHRLLILPARGDEEEPESTEIEVRTLGRRGDGDGEFNFPTSLSFGGGSLWVGDTLNFRLQRFEASTWSFGGAFGRLGDAAGEMPRLKGVAVDAAGRIWVSDAHLDQVALYRPDGTFLMAFGGRGDRAGEFSFPAGIAAHPDGRVAVVDSLNRRVQVFRSLNGG